MPLKQFQTNFWGGVLSPRTFARTDLEEYKNGVSAMVNWRPLLAGGAKRRPGMRRAYKWTGDIAVQLEEFFFDDNEAYLMVFRAGGECDVFDRSDLSTIATTITGGDWTLAMLGDLRVTQSSNTMIVVHPDMPTQIITRSGLTTFAVADFAFEALLTGAVTTQVFQPYVKYADSDITITPSATTGTITLTTSAAHWTADHVGVRVRIWDSGASRYRETEVTGFTSSTVVDARVDDGPLPGTSATRDWQEDAFSDVFGYPNTCVFHDQRLVFGGAKNLPNTMFLSQAGAFFNFDVGSGNPEEAIQASINMDKVSEIRALTSFRHLGIFTSAQEIYVPASNEALTPSNVSFRKSTSYGIAGKTQPQELAGSIAFLTSSLTGVHEFQFDDLQQAYDSVPISFLSENLFNSPTRQTTVIQTPPYTVTTGSQTYDVDGWPELYMFFLNADKQTIVGVHRQPSAQIKAWFTWTTSAGSAEIKDIMSVDSRLCAVVKRTINSSTDTYLEWFDESLFLDHAEEQHDATAKSSWTFANFANETVRVVTRELVGGEWRWMDVGEYTADNSGVIDLGPDIERNYLQVGYNYTPTLTTMPPEASFGGGSTHGEPRSVVRVIMFLHDAVGISLNGSELLVRNVNEDLSLPPTPVTDRREFRLLGWNRLGQVTITQITPVPLELLGLGIEVEI